MGKSQSEAPDSSRQLADSSGKGNGLQQLRQEEAETAHRQAPGASERIDKQAAGDQEETYLRDRDAGKQDELGGPQDDEQLNDEAEEEDEEELPSEHDVEPSAEDVDAEEEEEEQELQEDGEEELQEEEEEEGRRRPRGRGGIGGDRICKPPQRERKRQRQR